MLGLWKNIGVTSVLFNFTEIIGLITCKSVRFGKSAKESSMSRSTSLIHNIASEGKKGTRTYLGFESYLLKQKDDGEGIYRTEAPISVVFAVQPLNSVVFPLERKNSWLMVFLKKSALGLLPICSSPFATGLPPSTSLHGGSTCSILIRGVKKSLIRYLR